MHRQKSILSFLKKPAPDNQKRDDGIGCTLDRLRVPHIPKSISHSISGESQLSSISSIDSPFEVRGTDTPPEKVPRPIFSDKTTSSLFSSIKHKFAKVDNRQNHQERTNCSDGIAIASSISNTSGVQEELSCGISPFQHRVEENVITAGRTINRVNKGSHLFIEDLDDIAGPETPGMRPLVPRFKRIQEETCKTQATDVSLESSSNKRMKYLQDSEYVNKKLEGSSEMDSKFEWLDLCKIKDANGRRPEDPLYDKRTLYIPPHVLTKMTASQRQYWSVKSKYMDVILFFKVGKFYELYELDAEIGHKELNWKMTLSGLGKCRQVGISENGIDDAVQKLTARGYKVGRMEQLETSEQAKSRGPGSVIQRKLVQVITPSTILDGNIGPEAVHLLAIKEGKCLLGDGSTAYGFAFVDCAALKFWLGSFSDDSSSAALGTLMMQVSPKEVIYETQGLSREAQKAINKYSVSGSSASQLTPIQPAIDLVDASDVRNLIQSKGYFKSSCHMWNDVLDSIIHRDLALCALGCLVSHLGRLMLDDILHNGSILQYQVYKGCLRMDGQTIGNLEIFNNNVDGSSSGTLYSYLDNCVTPSGKRLLKRWICHPLNDVEEIKNRLNMVEILISHPEIMGLIGQSFRKIPDLERLIGRVKASFQSADSLVIPLFGKKVLKQRVKVFGSLVKGLSVAMEFLVQLLESQIIVSLLKVLKLPPLNGDEGLIKHLSQFEAAIDTDFPNYQDRDAKDIDAEILSVLVELFLEKSNEWSEVIQAISCIDVLRSFAINAVSSCGGSVSKPVILSQSKATNVSQETSGPILKLKGLWHPFAFGDGGRMPVPNDVILGEDSDVYHPRTLLLTGPNMGGKSTLLRATCLAVILAQIGAYVPCESCVLSLVDNIFTRLGATDRIMTGESTFFIECNETAAVLKHATQDSLVLLDELGRGTSTFDGYAIAYAVFRHLVEVVNCRLLFATHYHPLTKEFASHPHVLLQHMACTFKSYLLKPEQNLVFLYRLASGPCPESYGMQVALMAGIPNQVVQAASRAGKTMKASLGETFKSSEQRSEFSSLHEEWLKTLLTMSKISPALIDNKEDEDNDTFDTLFCLWHELKNSYGR
ncbi:DNA mismatch repair protein MSH7 [Impatiens glandulifera]|uniref:DNA mismatch repair protein MSH7 n=1 Tax=Impatiens glandulifera TaxID=253017 RepID=UPI001FB0D44A|nr:DNA mismatch repair protein MSH7 [Impatiens glandulifera]